MGLSRDYVEYILGLYRDYVGYVLGLYRDYVGHILGLYWNNGKDLNPAMRLRAYHPKPTWTPTRTLKHCHAERGLNGVSL